MQLLKVLGLLVGACVVVAMCSSGNDKTKPAVDYPTGNKADLRVIIEPTHTFDEISYSQLNTLVGLVRGSDYMCDSVTAAYPVSPGWRLVCDFGRHSYDFKDKGGHWVVTVE